MEIQKSCPRDLPFDWNILFCGGRTRVSSGLPPTSIRKWFGFHHFHERAFATVSWCGHARPWSWTYSLRASLEQKSGDPSSPRKGCIPSAVEGGSWGGEAGADGSVQGPWRLLLIALAPRLSDGLEGAGGSGFLHQEGWQPWATLPLTVMNKDTRVRSLIQMTPQRYTVK